MPYFHADRMITASDRFYWRTCAAIMTGNLFIGLGFILTNPLKTTNAYNTAARIVSLHTIGIVALAAAILFLIGIMHHNRAALIAANFIGSFYSAFIALTLINSYIIHDSSFSGVVWWGIVALLHYFAAIALPTTTEINRLKNDNHRRNTS